MVAPREGQSPRFRATNPIGASFRHQTNQSSTGWARHNTRNSRETSLSSKKPPKADLAPVSRDPTWKQAVVRPQKFSPLNKLRPEMHPPFSVMSLAKRTQQHVRNWEVITTDPWVLESISGYLTGEPLQCYILLSKTNSTETEQTRLEVQELLAKGAIQQVKDKGTPGFYSKLILVPKKGRPVINLKQLYQWIQYHHFKMEGISMW